MKRFATGNNAQFSELWAKLTEGASKRIKFNVVIATLIQATLVFMSNGNGGVKVSLITADASAAQRYTGHCEFIRLLLAGNEVEFATLAEMKAMFAEVKVDYRQTTNVVVSDTNSQARQNPEERTSPQPRRGSKLAVAMAVLFLLLNATVAVLWQFVPSVFERFGIAGNYLLYGMVGVLYLSLVIMACTRTKNIGKSLYILSAFAPVIVFYILGL